jgi:ATP-binding cassette subfamily F protein uup
MNLLTMDNIDKAYTDKILLENASFSIQENEKIGILGINGMGKSTLLKLIAGVELPDNGKIVMGNNIRIGYLAQEPDFTDDMTMIEAAVSADPAFANDMAKISEAKSMLNKLGMTDYDKKIGELSGGQKKRVSLVSVLINPVDILLLDEPTNHLDNEMSDWLEDYLIKTRCAIVMVTHDRYFLDRISTRIVEVHRGNIYSYPGNYSEYIRLKEARIASEFASERKRQSILRTELEWLARGARARSTKQKAHIQRIEEMQRVSAPRLESTVEMDSIATRMGKKTIELSHITKGYDGKVLINDFTYNFLRNDRIGFIGPNGCGKSTLIKIITGLIEPDSGSVEIGTTIKIGYFSQENEALDDSKKVIDYVKEIGEFIPTKDGSISASKMLERFLFEGSIQHSLIGKLSGGEKRRLYLLRILMGAPNVLILDEPTNDLDIETLTILEDYLDEFAGIIITVSHDRYFLDRVVTRIFAYEDNGHLQQYEGGYSDYSIAFAIRHPEGLSGQTGSDKNPGKINGGNQLGNNIKESAGSDGKASVETKNKGMKKLKFSFNEQREFETIDEDIENLESELEELDRLIMENATVSGKLAELTQQREKTQAKLDEKMERWIYLNDLNERIANGEMVEA